MRQAELFNSPLSQYDVLVASDAIGMGLNLYEFPLVMYIVFTVNCSNIKRVIFTTLQKYDGEDKRNLTNAEIKQIAGRAGRYNSHYSTGEVIWYDRLDVNLPQTLINIILFIHISTTRRDVRLLRHAIKMDTLPQLEVDLVLLNDASP